MDPTDLKIKFNSIGAPLELQDKIMRGRRETRLEYLWSEKTRHRLMIENETPPPVIDIKIVKGKETFIIDTFDDKNILLKVLDMYFNTDN